VVLQTEEEGAAVQSTTHLCAWLACHRTPQEAADALGIELAAAPWPRTSQQIDRVLFVRKHPSEPLEAFEARAWHGLLAIAADMHGVNPQARLVRLLVVLACARRTRQRSVTIRRVGQWR
jgi:hypothetical protein